MRSLTKLDTGSILPFNAIAESKQEPRKTRLKRLATIVKTQYEQYDSSAPQLQSLPPWQCSQTNKDDLIHCYDSPTSSLEELKVKIRAAQTRQQRAFCPYCGIDSNTTIEHYLPRSTQPVFSTCQYNLLPACSRCNSLKGDDWLDGSDRLVLHFYYDNPPFDLRWLFASVKIDPDGIPHAEYTLRLPPAVASPQVIQNHYDRLHLLERYRERSPEIFSEARAGMRRTMPEQDLVDQYLAKAEDYEAEYGVNYWKAAGFRGMANSSEFVNYVLTHIPIR